MKHHFCILSVFLLFSYSSSMAQNGSDSTKIYNSGFKEYYPIHEKPSIGYLSDMNSYENILFDAKPNVYYRIFNDMRYVMENEIYKPSYALYLTFQPHIRMYQENSRPVKTPSYKILLGGQVLIKTDNDNFVAFALESGHYSNGQARCAFDESLIDGSKECEALHAEITDNTNLSSILNRETGNFSTNLTKLAGSFRFNQFRSNDSPFRAHEFSFSYTLYHNLLLGAFPAGGYSKTDIEIYGRHRFGLGYEFMHNFLNKMRYTVSIQSEYIEGAHPFVEPWRNEISARFYPFNKDIGFFVSYINGHDNYNYRFVDSGNQLNIGVTWDWFAPFEIKRASELYNMR